MDTATGYSAVYHGVINNLTTTPVVTANIISDTLLEFGYPNISYIGKGATNNTVAISFNHSALTVFPGVSALVADDAGNYSPLLRIKTGVSYISIIAGNDRWGDYSGSQRKYNDTTGVVWLNGMFGNTQKKNTTWIAQLALTNIAGVGITEANKSMNEMMVFPNPTSDMITVNITLENSEYLNFEIYDITGRLVKVLLREKTKAGKNNFSFSTTPLSKGVYILKISSATNEVLSQKIIKE